MQTHPAPGLANAVHLPDDGHSSGVSWPAVFAGAAAAAALSFILLLLGVGLGLSSISPYAYNPAPLGAGAVAWIAFTQLAAAGLGGYLAGRLRLKWSHVHGDEVHFRDTAHGLLAWAVATLVTVALLAGGVKAALGGALDAAASAAPSMAAAVAADAPSDGRTAYFADLLLRSASNDAAGEPQRGEMNRILASSLAAGRLAPADRAYLAQVVARRAALDQAQAERRVDDTYARAAKAAAEAKAQVLRVADEARKAAAHSALWMFVALLFGAFVASLAATLGGRQRDHLRTYLRPTL